MKDCPTGCPGEATRRAGWAPCRAADERRSRAGDLVPLDAGLADSLAASPVELGRFLAEVGRVIFRASGTCMYPALRPGDILHVEMRPAAEIEVGDIAVVRRYGRFFGHRVVARQAGEQGPVIVTRPDRSFGGCDVPADEKDILGVVAEIERKGKILKAPKATARGFGRLSGAPALALYALGEVAREGAGEVVMSLQQLALYRRIASAFFAVAGMRYVTAVRLPLRPHLDTALSRVIRGEAVDWLDLRDGEGIPDSWSIVFEERDRTAASLSLFRRPGGCPHEGWWIAGATVRVRYRGIGLARLLLAKAVEILARCGEPPPRLQLPSGSPMAGWLPRELGWHVSAEKAP